MYTFLASNKHLCSKKTVLFRPKAKIPQQANLNLVSSRPNPLSSHTSLHLHPLPQRTVPHLIAMMEKFDDVASWLEDSYRVPLSSSLPVKFIAWQPGDVVGCVVLLAAFTIIRFTIERFVFHPISRRVCVPAKFQKPGMSTDSLTRSCITYNSENGSQNHMHEQQPWALYSLRLHSTTRKKRVAASRNKIVLNSQICQISQNFHSQESRFLPNIVIKWRNSSSLAGNVLSTLCLWCWLWWWCTTRTLCIGREPCGKVGNFLTRVQNATKPRVIFGLLLSYIYVTIMGLDERV